MYHRATLDDFTVRFGRGTVRLGWWGAAGDGGRAAALAEPAQGQSGVFTTRLKDLPTVG